MSYTIISYYDIIDVVNKRRPKKSAILYITAFTNEHIIGICYQARLAQNLSIAFIDS